MPKPQKPQTLGNNRIRDNLYNNYDPMLSHVFIDALTRKTTNLFNLRSGKEKDIYKPLGKNPNNDIPRLNYPRKITSIHI